MVDASNPGQARRQSVCSMALGKTHALSLAPQATIGRCHRGHQRDNNTRPRYLTKQHSTVGLIRMRSADALHSLIAIQSWRAHMSLPCSFVCISLLCGAPFPVHAVHTARQGAWQSPYQALRLSASQTCSNRCQRASMLLRAVHCAMLVASTPSVLVVTMLCFARPTFAASLHSRPQRQASHVSTNSRQLPSTVPPLHLHTLPTALPQFARTTLPHKSAHPAHPAPTPALRQPRS